jgi:hypothetical protein
LEKLILSLILIHAEVHHGLCIAIKDARKEPAASAATLLGCLHVKGEGGL